MVVGKIKKEVTSDDIKKWTKAKRVVPEFLRDRKVGSLVRVSDSDLKDYGEWLSKAPAKKPTE